MYDRYYLNENSKLLFHQVLFNIITDKIILLNYLH